MDVSISLYLLVTRVISRSSGVLQKLALAIFAKDFYNFREKQNGNETEKLSFKSHTCTTLLLTNTPEFQRLKAMLLPQSQSTEKDSNPRNTRGVNWIQLDQHEQTLQGQRCWKSGEFCNYVPSQTSVCKKLNTQSPILQKSARRELEIDLALDGPVLTNSHQETIFWHTITNIRFSIWKFLKKRLEKNAKSTLYTKSKKKSNQQ